MNAVGPENFSPLEEGKFLPDRNKVLSPASSPQSSPQLVTSEIASESSIMNFFEAMKLALENKSVRRLNWTDPAIVVRIVNERLMIYLPEDKLFHPLTVTSGDMFGKDWVVVAD